MDISARQYVQAHGQGNYRLVSEKPSQSPDWNQTENLWKKTNDQETFDTEEWAKFTFKQCM